MSTQSNDSLEAKIDSSGARIGSQVIVASTKLPTTASQQLWIDLDSRKAAGTQQPFALGAGQSTITSSLLTLSGKGTSGVLTTTLVTGADVTTATKAGFVRVTISDDNSVLTAGDYYLQLFTIT